MLRQPAAWHPRRTRYPFTTAGSQCGLADASQGLPLLIGSLSPAVTAVLDDLVVPDMQKVLRLWLDAYPDFGSEILPLEKQAAVLRRWLVTPGQRQSPLASANHPWPAPSAVNSTKTRVATAKMPWATTTGSGKFRSAGTVTLLVSDGPGAAKARYTRIQRAAMIRPRTATAPRTAAAAQANRSWSTKR